MFPTATRVNSLREVHQGGMAAHVPTDVHPDVLAEYEDREEQLLETLAVLDVARRAQIRAAQGFRRARAARA